jgi:hypothetical protein
MEDTGHDDDNTFCSSLWQHSLSHTGIIHEYSDSSENHFYAQFTLEQSLVFLSLCAITSKCYSLY